MQSTGGFPDSGRIEDLCGRHQTYTENAAIRDQTHPDGGRLSSGGGMDGNRCEKAGSVGISGAGV